MRPRVEYRPQAAHETRKAPVRFEVACGIGQYLVTGGEFQIAPRDTQAPNVRDGEIGVYALMDNAQPGLRQLRIGGLLSRRRTLPAIGGLQAEQVAEVLGADARRRVDAWSFAGVETDIGADQEG